jgi:hypothetical protein
MVWTKEFSTSDGAFLLSCLITVADSIVDAFGPCVISKGDPCALDEVDLVFLEEYGKVTPFRRSRMERVRESFRIKKAVHSIELT